jgi:hypothetical protein
MANRRKDKLDHSQPFARRSSFSLQEGAGAMMSASTIPVSRLSIFDIFPDPAQPRRALPLVVRQGWDGSPEHIESIFQRWYEAAAGENQQDVSGVRTMVRQVALSEESTRANEHVERKPGPLEAALLALADLAASIHDNRGLVNPITVVHDGDVYIIETGERRWLAYHLLNTLEAGKWFEISAREMRESSVWSQAYENNARDNLNAIAKARQLAVLLIDQYKEDGLIFHEIDHFDHEQDFYAQVADGSRYAIKRGASEKFVSAMGVQNARQLRDYRRLLRLPRIIWETADDRNWREGRIRLLLESAGGDENRLMELFYEELEMGDPDDDSSVPIGTAGEKNQDSVPIGTAESRKRAVAQDNFITPKDKKNFNSLIKYGTRLERHDFARLTPKRKHELLNTLDSLEHLISQMRSALLDE